MSGKSPVFEIVKNTHGEWERSPRREVMLPSGIPAMVEIFRRIHGEVPVVEMPAGSIPFGEAPHAFVPEDDEMWSLLARECEIRCVQAAPTRTPGVPWRFSNGSSVGNPDMPETPRSE